MKWSELKEILSVLEFTDWLELVVRIGDVILLAWLWYQAITSVFADEWGSALVWLVFIIAWKIPYQSKVKEQA